MAKYIESFVTGHGIVFESSKRNSEAIDKASLLWRHISYRIKPNGQSIIMLCGAKSNGKSSLLRYMVNDYVGSSREASTSEDREGDINMMADDEGSRVLKYGKKKEHYAYYIDYDPGQSEFTSPGMISAHIIRASAPPLRSPRYLNAAQHESLVMSSVGGTNMSVNPRMFIENCRYVFNHVKEHRKAQTVKRPIFVNTMGHIRNIGLAMLTDILKICRPSHLIVLNVENDPMRTIYADLSPKAVDQTPASFYYETSQSSSTKLDYTYDVHNLSFAFVDSTSISNKNRTALQLAYMATIPEALYKPIMQLSTKWISLKKTSIYCVSSYPLKEGIVLELLLHSWVHFVKLKRLALIDNEPEHGEDHRQYCNHDENNAGVHTDNQERTEVICRILDEVNENELFGCGIVAEIDLESRMMAVITPLDQETLDSKIDCVIKPLSVQVPPEMIQHDIYS